MTDYWNLAHGERIPMTSQPEDHNQAADTAYKFLDRITNQSGSGTVGEHLSMAHVYATLALVREQQVANRLTAQMISLTRAMVEKE